MFRLFNERLGMGDGAEALALHAEDVAAVSGAKRKLAEMGLSANYSVLPAQPLQVCVVCVV